MRIAIAIFILAAIAANGCSNGGSSLVVKPPIAYPPLVASDPANASRVLLYRYSGLDLAGYGALLTTDFEFVFDPADASGDPYRERGWSRDDELASAANLFVSGTTALAPVRRVSILLHGPVVALPDDRPGKLAPWHSRVSLPVEVMAWRESALWWALGTETFYLVRGDSAKLPSWRSPPADSTRWYFERWEESTDPYVAASLGAAPRALDTTPRRRLTWGGLKALYRN